MDKFVSLTPDKDLDFRRPFTAVVKETLTVTNTHPTEAIAFKVKTTAPKQYCVRPNSGRIPAGGTTDVQVLLQAMKEDPPLDFKCKDKFLVQCIRIPANLLEVEGDALQERLQDVWAHAESMKKSDPDSASEVICEKKLKVNFLPADSSTPTTSTTTINASPSLNSSTYAPSATAVTASSSPAPASNATVSRSAGSVDVDRELREAREQVKRLTAACEGYKSEIERLNMVRQRRAGAGGNSADGYDGGKSAAYQNQQQGGVQMQLAALIALIAFLLGAYLF
ncbi:phosphatidylinositol-binding protein scs2 [Chytridiales sp. JEL 0842]|nr:phosphatidylinositol-binding protein scs2 [Chytridiales sp. JEL 0842]